MGTGEHPDGEHGEPGIREEHRRSGSDEALTRLAISIDACDSGRLGLEAKKSLRRAIYQAFTEACDAVGVLPGELRREDRGDGVLAAVEPSVPHADMVGRWVDTLDQCVREHNRAGGVPLRLRVAMHAGPVVFDDEGLVGRAVDLTCRLCDSDAAKRAIEDARAEFLLVVSDPLYHTVVREGGRYIEPDDYVPHQVGNKETDEIAWFLLPRRTRTSASPTGARTFAPSPSATPDTPAAVPSGGGHVFHVRGDNQVIQDNVIHGPFTGIRKTPDTHERDERGERRG
jgi:class 3 adenylate cyclase